MAFVFQLIFKVSEVAKLREEERIAYEASLKTKWDTQNAFESVKRETREQFVKNLLLNTNFEPDKIASLADVSRDFVLKIQAKLQ